jgi:hypothetical protein
MVFRALLAALSLLLLGGATAPMPVPRPAQPVVQQRPVAIRATPVELAAPDGAGVRVLSAHVLRADDPAFGGLSGLLVAPDGSGALLVSDRGTLFAMDFERREGRINAVARGRGWALRNTVGGPLVAAQQDSEGLARLAEGVAVSFEGDHRIWRYPADWRRAAFVVPPEGIGRLGINSGIEALASDAEGRLYAMPERSGALDRPFPVWRRSADGEGWETGRWPRRPPFLVTGADIGPDGRLYVLERDFGWLSGWAIRLSVADLGDWPDFRPETLVTWRRDGIDNIEGVSIWRTEAGELRALLVSDDNFHQLQRTLLVELALE